MRSLTRDLAGKAWQHRTGISQTTQERLSVFRRMTTAQLSPVFFPVSVAAKRLVGQSAMRLLVDEVSFRREKTNAVIVPLSGR